MHEGSLAASVIDTCVDILNREDTSGTVTAVNLTVGVCQGVVPESLRLFFDEQKPGTPLASAELHITLEGMKARCPKCGVDHFLEEPVLICPECAGPLDLVTGSDILITSIEIDHDNHTSE